jgi:tyrosine-protein phosphatase YwqE
MSDVKLFRVSSGQVDELTGTTDTIEKSVQAFVEKNLETLLDVRFLAVRVHNVERRADRYARRGRKRLPGDPRI